MHSKNIKYFFLIFFFFKINLVFSEENKDFYAKNYCQQVNPSLFFNYKIPSEIIIETNNSKKWAKNLFSLVLEVNSNQYKIGEKNFFTFQIDKNKKKKFKSNINFLFKEPSYNCNSKAEINVRGDLWWHLDWNDGSPFSSMHVNLLNSHLNNAIKFDLLIPRSRTSDNKDINLELFITTLLNKLNLLAPKSYLVNVKINGHKYKYLLQEVVAKEFLESRNLVEGPLFRGDHRFTTDQSFTGWRGDLALARMINPSYSTKSESSKHLSFYTLSILNNIYMDNYDPTEDPLQSRCLNSLLTINSDKYFQDKSETKINELYEAIIYATETTHGFTCDDRKFYFDPIKKIFIPIYNDGKSILNWQNENVNESFKSLKFSENAIKGAEYAIMLINKIDDKEFYKELRERGFELNIQDFNKIKMKIINNLEFLKNAKSTVLTKHQKNYFDNINPLSKNAETRLIFINLEKDFLENCDFKLVNCEIKKIDKKEFKLFTHILSQNFNNLKKKYILNDKKNYLFLSTNKDYSNTDIILDKLNNKDFTEIDVNQKFKIAFNNFVKFSIDKENKKINFILLNQNARIKILGDIVENWSFNLNGEAYFKNNKNLIFEKNLDMLTGCLTFIDVELKNINILSNYSLCEDSVNFIRTKGNISNIIVNNSLSDAVDFDFSEVEIGSLSLNNAKNDCLDFSFGNYSLLKAKISNCEDKGISVGEKSKLTIGDALINNSNIGVASKDSSQVMINKISINSKTCLASYRKKQEFSGAIIDYKNLKCSEKQFIAQDGSIIRKNDF